MHEVLTAYRRQRIATRRRHWIAAWWWRWQGWRIRWQRYAALRDAVCNDETPHPR
jgi:hypothetical protein